MHAERAVPAGTNFPIGNFQSFLLYFLYFTKSRKIAAEGGGEAAERQKDLIGFVRSCCLCALIRGLQNLESPCEGERIVTFCVVQKVTKKHVLGRAKSCRWQVFVRRRPPKQGELRTDVSKATMFQGVDSVLRPRFKSPLDT